MGKIEEGVRAPLAPEEAVGNGKDALAASMALRQNYGRVGVGVWCG